METIDATIRKIVFHKLGKFGRPGGVPYLIARTSTGDTIKGQMRTPIEGQQYRLWGDWKPQKGYPDAFEFINSEALCDRSTGGIAVYLAKGNIPGIGPVKAQALVDAFGVDTLDILRKSPDRALEVRGISEEIVESIRRHFAEASNQLDPVAMAKLIELFEGYKVPRRVIESCVKSWGSDAPNVIRDNPYLLMSMPRMGWKSTDPIATERFEYPEDGEFRHTAALIESLTRLSDDGHTAATKAELLNGASILLGSRLNPTALQSAIRKGYIVASDDGSGVVYQLADLARAEETIAERLRTLRTLGPGPVSVDPDKIRRWAIDRGLADEQASAMCHALTEPVSILTGGPGTGKSRTIAYLVMWLREHGYRSIRVVAPTGKAAKRTLELLLDVGINDVPCTTIHKALQPEPPTTEGEGVPADDAKFGRGREGWGFGRHIANPLDERTIIIEEKSMVDAKLEASLLSAIAPGTRVISVGDSHQLPSVGPGSVLRDMIVAGIPTATLTEIRRSDSAGTVVHACHAIIRGEIPRPADCIDLSAFKNWVHHEVSSPADMRDKIVELASGIPTDDRMWDVQVISPQKAKLLFGCDHLNSVLSQTLNAENHVAPLLTDPESGEIIDVSGNPKVGDKVVRTKNAVVDELIKLPDGAGRADLTWDGDRYKCSEVPVVNGDMGTVVDILDDERACYIVSFRDPERLVRLPMSEAFIDLAYCMTVHKCQGSGFKRVIVPVSNSFYYDEKTGRGLWNRELGYTMISRTEVELHTVGQFAAFETACRRQTVHRRRTTLVARLGGRLVPAKFDESGLSVYVEPQDQVEPEWAY